MTVPAAAARLVATLLAEPRDAIFHYWQRALCRLLGRHGRVCAGRPDHRPRHVVEALRAENERLLWTLGALADTETITMTPEDAVRKVRRIARAALGESQEGRRSDPAGRSEFVAWARAYNMREEPVILTPGQEEMLRRLRRGEDA